MEKKEESISLFAPKTKRGLLEDYPELKDAPELKDLNKSEILFVWFFACKASPISHVERSRIRSEEALKRSFDHLGKENQMKPAVRDKFASCNFGSKIKRAIDRMSKYNPSARDISRRIIENTLNNFSRLSSVEMTDASFVGEDGKVDYTKKNAYVTSQNNIVKALDAIVLKSEHGFGVTEKQIEEEDAYEYDGDSLADDYHEQTN